ncbi:MAG: sulfatase-like hydrolase/transferase, partial [Pirellulaceae bacterium]
MFDYLRERPSLRDKTLILVCSDNGPEPGAGSAGPFRGAKTRLYEGGIRSPLIVWGPGLMAAESVGTHNETSVFAAFDLAPSLLALTRVPQPKEVTFDGEDLSATLMGRSLASRVAPIFWRRPPDRKNSPPALPEPQPDLAVRDGDWKLLCNYDGSQPELYDLAGDRSETTNVADQFPQVVQRLTAALLEWHRSMPADLGPQLGGEAAKPRKAKTRAPLSAKPGKNAPNVLMLLVDD